MEHSRDWFPGSFTFCLRLDSSRRGPWDKEMLGNRGEMREEKEVSEEYVWIKLSLWATAAYRKVTES